MLAARFSGCAREAPISLITRCRVCLQDDFTDVLDLGSTPYADAFVTEAGLAAPEVHLPLKVVVCDHCRLVQLTYVAPREALYRNDYPYVSSTTDQGVRHYHAMARDLVARFAPDPGSLAVDIGSNVGVLADGFRRQGLTPLGVEPAPAIARAANLDGIETIGEFFSADLAAEIRRSRGPAAVVTGTNVVAHIDDLHDLVDGVRQLLAPGGVFVFEAPYLVELLRRCAYDTIYHEHLSYLAIRPVQALCAMYGLEVFDVEPQRIHGGTLRYYIAAQGAHARSLALGAIAAAEDHLCDDDALAAFAAAVAAHRRDLGFLLHDLRHRGWSIAAVSAPAKGMTLLNYCGIGPGLLDFVTEKAPLKVGKYTPGTHLPILPDAELLRRQPDYALLLAWNFAEEIMANLAGYAGRFIVPIPQPVIVEREVTA